MTNLSPAEAALNSEETLQVVYDLWQARQAVTASKALSRVKVLKLQPA